MSVKLRPTCDMDIESNYNNSLVCQK